MNISVVIPNYNGEKLLKKNLPCILEAAMGYEVLVVDDASTDGSVQLLKEKFPNIKVVGKRKNEGFASTVNDGVEAAKGDLVLLLNSDCFPEKDFLEPLLSHFKDPEVFAAGCGQKCPEKEKVILRGRGIGKFDRGFLVHARGAVGDKDTSDGVRMHSSEVEDFRKTLWVSGGAGIYRKAIWQELGGMDTLYNPFYWEDIDISYRALKSGYKLIFEPKSIVRHEHGKGIIMTSQKPEYVKTVAYRNQIIFVWLNISDADYLWSHFLFLPYHLLKSLISRDFAFLKGFFTAIPKIPRIVRSRLKYGKLWKNTDREVINAMGTSFMLK